MSRSKQSALWKLGSVVLTGILALVVLIVLQLLGFTGAYAPVIAFAVAIPILVYGGSGPVDIDAESYRDARGQFGVTLDVAIVIAVGMLAGVLATYAVLSVGFSDPIPQAGGIVAVVLAANLAFFARNWAFLRVAGASED